MDGGHDSFYNAETALDNLDQCCRKQAADLE